VIGGFDHLPLRVSAVAAHNQMDRLESGIDADADSSAKASLVSSETARTMRFLMSYRAP